MAKNSINSTISEIVPNLEENDVQINGTLHNIDLNGTISTPEINGKLPIESEAAKNLEKQETVGSKIDEEHITVTSFKEMTLKEKCQFIKTHITVEPMVACYIMPCVFASLATQNLAIEKACRVNLKYPAHVCDALSARNTANYSHEEAEVQQLVAAMGVWKTILQSALPALLIMFVGSWSDRWGLRKPCMMAPVVGEFFTILGLMVSTYYFYELPMEIVGFVEGFFPALTGGWFTMFMGIFSYIGDVTTVEERTLRIGIVNVFCSLGIPVGLALSGVAYRKIGFYGVFSITAVMYVMAFFYCHFYVKEPKTAHIQRTEPRTGFIKDFFNFKHVMETFRVAFKKGENNRKLKVLLLMLVVMVVIGPMHGELFFYKENLKIYFTIHSHIDNNNSVCLKNLLKILFGPLLITFMFRILSGFLDKQNGKK